jgi:hypothetical protein
MDSGKNIITLTNVILVIEEKVLKKSIFSLCPKSLTTRRAFYLSTVPSDFSLFFKIHIQHIGFERRAESTKF